MATRRRDLEALPFKAPPYIGARLMPYFTVGQKTGTIYFDDIVADATAQTDRTLGTAPTAVRIDSANSSFTVTEKIKRYKIDESEIELRGGLAAAQAKMSRKGKRSVLGRYEETVIASTFGDESNINSQDILASFLQALDVAVETILDYSDGTGIVALFGAHRVIQRLKRYDEVVEKMKFTGVLANGVNDVRAISNNHLASALDIDLILNGPTSTTYWLGGSSAYDGWLGLMVIPESAENAMDPDEQTQFGRQVTMPIGDGDGGFKVETYYSDDLKSEVCDTTGWQIPFVMNKELCYILKGIDEENTVTTTT